MPDLDDAGEPDWDGIVRVSELPTFGGFDPKPKPAPAPFDRAGLDGLCALFESAERAWLDDSVPDGAPEVRDLRAAMNARFREFGAAFLASVPAGTRLTFGAEWPREYWHGGGGILQSRRATKDAARAAGEGPNGDA